MLQKFFAKLAAKLVARKLNLKDGPMEDKKKWFQSKTIWAAVYVISRMAYDGVRTLLIPSLPEIPQIVETIMDTLVGVQVVRSRLHSQSAKPIV